MGTRSLTIVKNRNGDDIIVMYRQMDGYPDGHGLDLANHFGGFRLCNGISISGDHRRMANGLECLAAQIVAHFKQGIGAFYLHPSGTRDCDEQYRYEIYSNDGESLNIRVVDVGWNCPDTVLYDGPISGLGNWIEDRMERE